MPKVYSYTYRATVTYEITINATNEDEAFEIMEMSNWSSWEEKGAEVWLEEVQEAGPDRIDHVED